MRDQSTMQEHAPLSASEMHRMTANAGNQKSILRKRTTSEGDALKLPRKDDDVAHLIGGGWKALGLDFDDDDVVPSVMSCQVAVVKEFDKSTAKEINSFKNLGNKKVDKTKYGGGPCLFGQGKVPVPQVVPTKGDTLSKVNMEDPSSLLKDGAAPSQELSQPPKQLPLPPMLKKKDTFGALNNALTRAMSQPGSRAASRPDSPSHVLSLPPDSSQQVGDTSDLLSLAAQDLQSSLSATCSSTNQQTTFQQASAANSYHGIDHAAMSQIMQNTTAMQSNAVTKQSSVWGFTDGGVVKSEVTSEPFKPLSNKSKSVSTLNFDSFEINDPKPREEEKPMASFKPLEPSRQTHNSPIKVPKPVSPTTEGSKVGPFSKKNPPPPVEARGSVLAPKTDSVQSQQSGLKKTDYSRYLDLINDGSEEIKEEICQAKPAPVKQLVQKSFAMEDSISKNSVKGAKSMFESNNLSNQHSKNMSKSCGNLNKFSMSASNGSIVSNQSPKSLSTQFPLNEPKLQGTEAASASTQLKVQSGHNLASLLAKDEMQSSMVINKVESEQNEVGISNESLVHNVRATSAKWSESLKKEEKVITFGQSVGVQNLATNMLKSSVNITKNSSMGGKTSITVSAPERSNSLMHKGEYSTGLGLSSSTRNGSLSQYAGNPEQLLMKSTESAKTSGHPTQAQQFQRSNSMQKTVNGSASIAVLEQQKKIELERQKQIEYEMNQRMNVVNKDAQRNLIFKQNEESELQLQLERRRALESQLAEQQIKQQEEDKRRQEAMQIRLQEEEKKIKELEKQRLLDIKKQEEQKRIAEAARRQEEERRKAEVERQRILEIQRQEEERKRAEVERQRLLEIQRQEEVKKQQEAEKQRLLEIQRQQEEQRKAEAERQLQLEFQRQQEEQQRLLELRRQEEERLRLETERAIQLQKQKEEEERKRVEEQERIEALKVQEEKQRVFEEEQKRQFQVQQEQLQLEARCQQQMEIQRYQESQFQLEQQRILEMQSLQQSVGGTNGSIDEERNKRQKMHEEQLRLLRQKQEEEQRQLLLLHQQEEALWESKKTFIQNSSSTLERGLSQDSTSSVCCERSATHQLSFASPVHEPVENDHSTINVTTDHNQTAPPKDIETYQVMEAVSATKPATGEGSDLVEYSAPVIHNGSRPSPAKTMIIPSESCTPKSKSHTPISPTQTPKQAASPLTKVDIVDDPLSFLLADSPTSVCSSVSSAAPTPSPVPSIIPSAPAPPPLQPSYASIATGDAISELRSRFNESPIQPSFHNPIAPSPSVFNVPHNPPSKMHSPLQNNDKPPPTKLIQQSPTSSTRQEVVSPNTQRKRLMAQCMSEAAGIKNASVIPSQLKAAKRKTTKSRVERFIEASCGDPQTIVRKTASGQEYLEVISPESTELARSLLEPAASR